MSYRSLQSVIALLVFLFLATSANAQVSPAFYDFPQNHLSWYTIESEHFFVHYQEGNDRSAQISSKIAEEIYKPITSLYGLEPPRKTSIVLKDREDFSNGAAFFFDDKIEIWLPSLNTPLRGTHDWLRNVITHEFTHMVQLQASMKRSRNIPAIFLQWINYEEVRRPDVLFGFPNGIVTLPLATVSIPAWFAEGTAQYQRADLEYDRWDTHRDMLLRTRMLSDTYLSFVEMGHFNSKNSVEREGNYNQGFSFVTYLTERFGEQIVADLSTGSANGPSDFSRVMKQVTGYSGEELFEDWVADRKQHYRQQVSSITATEETIVEPDGFFNFFPQYSQAGTWFGYLSNRGRDHAATKLILQNGDRQIEIEGIQSEQTLGGEQLYQMEHGLTTNMALDFISNRFSFSPDEQSVAFSMAKRNRRGETYQDVYVLELGTDQPKQLTQDARIQDPNWHPSGESIIGVRFHRGTQNLVLIDPVSGNTEPITQFEEGETIYNPVWHPNGEEVYFTSALHGTRNIYKLNVGTGTVQTVFADNLIDFRNVWVNPAGDSLYFASDISGIFNIYRSAIGSVEMEQLTDRIGGAFMPHLHGGELYYATYHAEGYKIAKTELRTLRTRSHVQQMPFPGVAYQQEEALSDTFTVLNAAPDYALSSLNFAKDTYDGEPVPFQIETEFGSDERSWSPYNQRTTGVNVLPIVRFDNYTKLRGSNSKLLSEGRFGSFGENLWRDMKLGAFLSSRDVTERVSLFGGALFGFGSLPADGVGDFISPNRLNSLDRDLFFIFEHRGIPFIETSWSPTVSFEVFNLKRNVRDGITIEEFPCTSCLPQSKGIDIRYSIWEANLFLRSKLNRWSLLEFGGAFSPFSVSTEGFFSDELQQPIPGSTSEFFRGWRFSTAYYAELIEPTRHADIAPQGFKGSLTYRFEPSRLLDEFEVTDGVLSPVFESFNNHSFELRSRYGFPLTQRSTGMVTARAFSYLNSPDEFFFLDYTGGLVGLRSYPFFAIGGHQTAFARASFLTPIFESINRQAGPYSIDKIFAHLFVETGNGWGGPLDIGDRFKSGVGAELRFAFNSHYLFPLKFFFNTTYGFDQFDVTLPDAFITGTQDNTVTYGREFLFYLGLTFDFDLL
ncbi:MAG: hypothetical protein ACNA78_03565 [Balneolaceae bacterium]